MRRIKFRAWNKRKPEMIYFDLYKPIVKDWWPHIKETTMQYTGLKDKKGVEIYEGDIISERGDSDNRGMVVAYSNGMNDCLGMDVGWCLEQDDFERWIELKYEEYHVVIGNIYENPELLKRK